MFTCTKLTVTSFGIKKLSGLIFYMDVSDQNIVFD